MNKLLILLFLLLTSTHVLANKKSDLHEHNFIHGNVSCENNTDPKIEIYEYSAYTYILRQNKCTHYEAPFIYVLFGDNKVLIQDTGATKDAAKFPLYSVVMELVNKHALLNQKSIKDYEIIVSHSHSHSDHIAGDEQFKNKKNIRLINPTSSSVQSFFGYDQDTLKWPSDNTNLELGNRNLTIIPIPGHQSESIAIYDPKHRWLLTGDTFYPGRLYIKNWQKYKLSISRLVSFSKSHPVLAIMGTHIEMSDKPGIDYPIGSTYQPNEAPLPLELNSLLKLNAHLKLNTTPKKVVTDKFFIYPID